jgi:hypothetical protein
MFTVGELVQLIKQICCGLLQSKRRPPAETQLSHIKKNCTKNRPISCVPTWCLPLSKPAWFRVCVHKVAHKPIFSRDCSSRDKQSALCKLLTLLMRRALYTSRYAMLRLWSEASTLFRTSWKVVRGGRLLGVINVPLWSTISGIITAVWTRMSCLWWRLLVNKRRLHLGQTVCVYSDNHKWA